VTEPAQQPAPRAAGSRPTITVVYKRNTIDGTPNESYHVIRIVNSLDYYPGDILTRTDVERIYAEGGWELIVE